MQQFLEHIQSQLKYIYTEQEIQNLTFLLVEKVTGWNRIDFILNKNTIFSNQDRILLASFVEKLQKQEPIQYILKETWFYGLKFMVNKSVLIPRPETEELVEWILSDNKVAAPHVLDIGTGSGCIAISLKKKLESKSIVSAWDLSSEALEVATQNALTNEVSIDFAKKDILSDTETQKNWDIIVSNPPYIPDSEANDMEKKVTAFEPRLALFVPDNNALIFYDKIADFALQHLNKNGKLYFEIHKDMGAACVSLLARKGFLDIELRKDISGNDRMIKAVI